MSNLSQKNEKKKTLTELEVEDLARRLNEAELNIIEAKEFSHISSDAFDILQTQINELKEIFELLVVPKETSTSLSEGIYL